MTIAHALALAAALILNATANLLMKFGMRDIARGGDVLSGGVVAAATKIMGSPQLIVGVACFGLNLLCYMYALQRMKISVAYPIMVSTGFAIIVAVAGWRLGERLSATQWAGVVMILVGVCLVATRAGTQLEG